MSSGSEGIRTKRMAALVVAAAASTLLGAVSTSKTPSGEALRVCADPNNLPFSNARGEGFENKLAALVAKDLGKRVEYAFWPQRRGFIRSTLDARVCDVVMGVPASFERVGATAPYYRSSYVFVTPKDVKPVASFDDPRLRTLRIGLHVIGDDYSNVPPAEALARRGIVDNIRGYPIYGSYSDPDPPRALLDALARGEIDVAIVWGPIGGYFARREPVPFTIVPVSPASSVGPVAMVFDISVGVRRGDGALKEKLEHVLVRHRREVRRLLVSYGVPLSDGSPEPKMEGR